MATGAPEFQGALVRLADALSSEARKVTKALARLDQADAMRYATDAYPEIASPFLASAGDFAATWYEDQPTTSDTAFYATPADLPAVEQLGANARWALTQHDPAGALDGSARRQLFNQARETVLNNAEEEPGTKWIRHARSGACGFCRMLATRALTEGHGGAPGLYNTEATASMTPHRKFEVGHDRCRCIIIPLRPGAEYVVPDYLPQWLSDYYLVSRDADDRLLNPQVIADRMEAIGRERGDYGDKMHHKPPGPDIVDLDQSAITSARHLTERNAARADELVRPVAERVKAAKDVAEQADAVVSKASAIAGRVKTVVDVADTLLGDGYPAIRAVKKLVDETDKALVSAKQVTGHAATVTRVAERTLRDTTAIAHGAKQLVDDVSDVLDEAEAIARDAKKLAENTRQAIADVRGAGGLRERANLAVEAAIALRAEGEALVERARGTIDAATDVVEAVGEIPNKLRAPIRDLESLARHVQGVAQDAQKAGEDAGIVVRTVRALVDMLRDGRRADTTEVDEQGAPIRVQSERVTAPADAIEAPARQLALNRAPVRLAIEGPSKVVAGASEIDAPPPDAGAIAEWLDAEDEHRAAVEYWRRVDDENLHSLPPLQRIPEPENLELRPAETVEQSAEPLDGEDEGVADVQADDHQGETPLNRAVRELEEAIAGGDDDAIDRAIAVVDAEEAAEAKAVERRAKGAERRQAAADAEAERMSAAIEAGDDPVQAEADMLMGRPAQVRKVRELAAKFGDEDHARSTVYNATVERIRRRDFMAQARAEGHTGKGFDDLVDSVFARRVDEIYIDAENATRGQLVTRAYVSKFDPKRFWYVNDATARKYMSDELAEWFDANGRITRPVFRQMILDGQTHVRYLGEDYLR